jgi:hypothetical protein
MWTSEAVEQPGVRGTRRGLGAAIVCCMLVCLGPWLAAPTASAAVGSLVGTVHFSQECQTGIGANPTMGEVTAAYTIA